MTRKRKQPINKYHDIDVTEAMETVELRNAKGGLIDPNALEDDPDWNAAINKKPGDKARIITENVKPKD